MDAAGKVRELRRSEVLAKLSENYLLTQDGCWSSGRCGKKFEPQSFAQESFPASAHLELSNNTGSLEARKVADVQQAGDAALEPAGPFLKKCFRGLPAES